MPLIIYASHLEDEAQRNHDHPRTEMSRGITQLKKAIYYRVAANWSGRSVQGTDWTVRSKDCMQTLHRASYRILPSTAEVDVMDWPYGDARRHATAADNSTARVARWTSQHVARPPHKTKRRGTSSCPMSTCIWQICERVSEFHVNKRTQRLALLSQPK